MRILHLGEIEILFPVGTFFLKRGGAETGFDPAHLSVGHFTRRLHILEILVAGYRALPKVLALDCAPQRMFAPLFYPCSY
jgi:hypothetical protein